MGSNYTDANLIPYDQTIIWCLYGDKDVTWLELRNYADVINGGSSDEVATAIVGVFMSNGQSQTLNDDIMRGWTEQPKAKIPLGHYFDAKDVIRLQRKLLEFSQDRGNASRFKTSLDFANAALKAGFELLGFSDAQLADGPLKCLGQNLHPKLGPPQARLYESYGFRAYFPKPSLMLQEERTRLTTTEKGWTINSDWRKLPLIKPGKPCPPEAFPLREVFDAVDTAILNAATRESSNKKSSTLNFSPAATKVQPKTAEDMQLSLHNMLTRVDCYAFRGDGRTPEMVNKHGGTKANTSRTDPAAFTRAGQSITLPLTQGKNSLTVEQYAAFLDECLRPKGVYRVKAVDADNGQKRPETYADIASQFKISERDLRDANTIPGINGNRQDIEIKQVGQWVIIPGFEEGETGTRQAEERAEGFWDSVHNFLLDLSAFTVDQTFKLLISTTKSTAIAKHFINDQAVSPDRTDGHVYAMRCRGGFELPSDVPPDTVNAGSYLSKLHTALNYPEQEVTMPVVIMWDDFVGFRLVLIRSTGPYFAGPIFLHDRLRNEDPKVFDELFELFSGQSQGPSVSNPKGDGRIEQVYSETGRYEFVAQDKYS